MKRLGRNRRLHAGIVALLVVGCTESDETDANTDTSMTATATTGAVPAQPGDPRFDEADVYSLDELPGLSDPTDVYVPEGFEEPLPAVVLLQGANVDKQYYSGFATLVARYGFVVVVPNHTSTSFAGEGLFMQQSVVVDALAGVAMLSADPTSPLQGSVDESRSGLLGHSYGGVVGINALSGQCTAPFCTGSFELPASVKAGVFFGTDMRSPLGGDIEPVANVVALGLIGGSLDTKATLPDVTETYAQLQSGPAALVTVDGLNHYGMNDVDSPPGAEPEDVTSAVAQPDAVDRAARFAGVLLRAWILEDADAAAFLADPMTPGVTVETK